MKFRLWYKLTGAFALVIVIGVFVTVALARQGTANQFAHLMINSQMVQPEQLQQLLVDFYRKQGTWQNVDERLKELLSTASQGNRRGMMEGMPGMMNDRLQVIDVNGRVVADTGDADVSLPMSGRSTQRWPLVLDREEVGVLLVEGSMMGLMAVDDRTLLSGVTRAVLVAGLVAGFVALLLGGILVRQITRPLATLAQASGRITAGDLSVRVPIKSHDELGELAGTFNRMAEGLQTQETLRRNLMADVAHELRTPLAAIQGTVEALQDGIFPLTTENLMPIHSEVTLLNHLVEDLRTLANAEAGSVPLDHAPIDIAELIERQVQTFQFRAAERGIRLLLDRDPKIRTIWGDGQRLNQVLGNLLDNALRHTPESGSVIVRVTSATAGVQISVRDSGEGIPEAELPHVFERFYRVDRSRNRETGGSGLGLSIVRQLVEAHGGRVWVDSPPAGETQGTEFSLFLPLGSSQLTDQR